MPGEIWTFFDGFWSPTVAFLNAPTSNAATLTSFAVAIIGGLWAYRDMRRRDLYFPKMEFLVDILSKVETDDAWIVEAVCSVRNRGIVRFQLREITFDIRGFPEGDAIDETRAEIGKQVYFRAPLHEGTWYRDPSDTFVEAGTTQYYRHVVAIPKSMAAALIHGKLVYQDRLRGKKVSHTADRLVRMPTSLAEADAYVSEDRLRNYLRDRGQANDRRDAATAS